MNDLMNTKTEFECVDGHTAKRATARGPGFGLRQICATASFALGFSLCAAFAPTTALALPAFTLDVDYDDPSSGDLETFDYPRFNLTNVSTAGESIASFSITLGDTDNYFFDFVPSHTSNPVGDKGALATEDAVGATLVVGDRVRDGAGTTALEWSFDAFVDGEVLTFDAEIVRATPTTNPYVDSRQAFVPDGAASNAFITVVFGDGSVATTSFETPEEMMPESFQLYGEGAAPTTPPIPEPTGALLFGIGLLTAAQARPSKREGSRI